MVRIYVEGGGVSGGNSRCREGFRRLLEKCGFKGRMPKIVACGSRNQAYDKFKTALSGSDKNIMLLVDSEDPVRNINETWEHLRRRDNWDRPQGAVDNDVLFMTTCMETWIVADHAALKEYFGNRLMESALPPLQDIESRNRKYVYNRLVAATRQCPGPYKKGPKSYEVLGRLDPERIEEYLPSFKRMRSILNSTL